MKRVAASLLALTLAISPALAQTSPSRTDRVVGGGRPGAGISSESNRNTTTGARPTGSGEHATGSTANAPDPGATSATAGASK